MSHMHVPALVHCNDCACYLDLHDSTEVAAKAHVHKVVGQLSQKLPLLRAAKELLILESMAQITIII